MEDDLNFWVNGRRTQFFVNGRQPQYVLQIEDDLIFWVNGGQPPIFTIVGQVLIMEDGLIF